MPAITTLKEIQGALALEDTKSHLDSYVIGILVYEQSKSRKAQIKAETQFNKELEKLGESSLKYQALQERIRACATQLDLGFYYTIDLLDQLANTHPHEARQMIEAVLSFDTMGRYLFEQQPTILDGKPFALNALLERNHINPVPLKVAAWQNQSNTDYIRDIKSIPRIAQTPIAFSLPGDYDRLDDPTKRALRSLKRKAETVSESESLLKTASAISFDFTLVSQSPTKASIHHFLSILAEIFAHAKMQDSSKLDTLNVQAPQGSSVKRYSTTAFLQNTLSPWLILSLVQAPNANVFEQRLRFIMAAFAKANKKNPGLPENANADMYLPLIIFAKVVLPSALEHHPLTQPNLDKIKALSKLNNAQAITKYTNQIKCTTGGKTSRLVETRMGMTTHLTLSKEYADLSDDTSPERSVRASIVRGDAIYNYFNPSRQSSMGAMENMSTTARRLMQALPHVESIFKNFDVSHERGVLLSTFPLYKADDHIEKQLQVLASALQSTHPRIFVEKKNLLMRAFTPLQCYENMDAVNFIEKAIGRLTKKLHDMRPVMPEYNKAVNLWSAAILNQVRQLNGYSLRKQSSEADLGKYACASSRSVYPTPGVLGRMSMFTGVRHGSYRRLDIETMPSSPTTKAL